MMVDRDISPSPPQQVRLTQGQGRVAQQPNKWDSQERETIIPFVDRDDCYHFTSYDCTGILYNGNK